MRDRDTYPSQRDPAPRSSDPLVRPRGAPPINEISEREVERRTVGAADHHPLPPPVTAGFDDGARDPELVTVVEVESVTFYDDRTAEALERDRILRAGRARYTPTGFLDAHGADGPGFLATHGANGPGFLATHGERAPGFLRSHGADAPGWLASLDQRRRAARALGWQPAEPRTRSPHT